MNGRDINVGDVVVNQGGLHGVVFQCGETILGLKYAIVVPFGYINKRHKFLLGDLKKLNKNP